MVENLEFDGVEVGVGKVWIPEPFVVSYTWSTNNPIPTFKYISWLENRIKKLEDFIEELKTKDQTYGK